MAYKTVLVHIDESARTARRVAVAASIARLDGGHLIGVALTGVSRLLYQEATAGEPDPHLELHLGFLRERASRAQASFAAQAATLGLASFEARVADDEAGAGVSLLARYADLVVIGQTDPAAHSVQADFPASVLLDSGRPVLIVPYAGPAPPQLAPFAPRHILIAWNASKEAGRAVNAALPLLQRAGQVHVAICEPARDVGAHGSEAGAELARYLARHAVASTLSVHKRGRHGRAAGTGETLLSLAADRTADLLVMGAYGHSRLRQTVLGGVTRTVLGSMTTPVLMAH